MRTIQILEKPYPVKFGLFALKTMLAKYKLKTLVDTEALMGLLEVDYLPNALKLGIDNGCKIMGVEPPTLDEITEAFESNLSLMTEVIQILAKDISGEPEQVEDEKKEIAKPGPVYKN